MHGEKDLTAAILALFVRFRIPPEPITVTHLRDKAITDMNQRILDREDAKAAPGSGGYPYDSKSWDREDQKLVAEFKHQISAAMADPANYSGWCPAREDWIKLAISQAVDLASRDSSQVGKPLASADRGEMSPFAFQPPKARDHILESVWVREGIMESALSEPDPATGRPRTQVQAAKVAKKIMGLGIERSLYSPSPGAAPSVKLGKDESVAKEYCTRKTERERREKTSGEEKFVAQQENLICVLEAQLELLENRCAASDDALVLREKLVRAKAALKQPDAELEHLRHRLAGDREFLERWELEAGERCQETAGARAALAFLEQQGEFLRKNLASDEETLKILETHGGVLPDMIATGLPLFAACHLSYCDHLGALVDAGLSMTIEPDLPCKAPIDSLSACIPSAPDRLLNARFVLAVKEPGQYADGGGLYLRTTLAEKQWIFIFHWQGEDREMSLGCPPDVSLACARKKSADARNHIRENRNPIEALKG